MKKALLGKSITLLQEVVPGLIRLPCLEDEGFFKGVVTLNKIFIPLIQTFQELQGWNLGPFLR